MAKVKKVGILVQYCEKTPFTVLPRHLEMVKEVVPDAEVIAAESEEDMLKYGLDCDVILSSRHTPLSMRYFKKANQLKWMQCLMAGVDGLLLPEMLGKVRLTSTRGIHGLPISEHVLALMLALNRGLHISRDNQHRKLWKKYAHPEEIREKTVAIVGLGEIGTMIAQLCKAVGMRVVGTNLILPENDNLLDAFYPVERKEEMFGIADFVVLIVPYTLETHHLIGEEQLKAMKNTAYLINVARGKVIDEAVLIKALKEKWIAGAGLDVQYTEPLPPDNQLWNLENVILTPHTAAISSRYMDRAVAVFCDNLKRFVEDKELKFEFK